MYNTDNAKPINIINTFKKQKKLNVFLIEEAHTRSF